MSTSLMIVDDSATMRKIVMRTVRMAGLTFDRIEEAGNGIEALAKLSAGPVDVMLCDVNMPEMGGLELVKKVRELGTCAATKIIIVSTESSEELVNQAMTNGANGHISKPFTPEKFQGKFSQCMN
jgi:two-component system chemotaxis response regulator CheY